MGKLRVGVMRFLPLCAALLVLPAITSAQCISQLTVQRVFTRDALGNEKTTFLPGETLQFAAELNNSYGAYLLAGNGTQLAITTSFYNNTSPVDIPGGISTWIWNASAPSGEDNYPVTVQAYDHFCGVWVEESGSFTVGGSSPSADLRPTVIRYNPADLVSGRTVFFDSGVRNSGAQGTEVFNIRWFVDGVSVGYGSHEGVPANNRILDGNSQFSWVATAGTHTIKFAVDVDNHVLESNESNNSRPVTVTVQAQIWDKPEGRALNLIVLVHGCCTDENDVKEWNVLGKQIAKKIKKIEDWEIVVWDWSKYTPKRDYANPLNPGLNWFIIDANKAYDNARDQPGQPGQGSKLAAAIVAAVNKSSVNAYEYIHFIAHSAGAKLIHEAATKLIGNKKIQQEKPFIHLTFLDAYTRTKKDSGEVGGQSYGYLEGYDEYYAEHYVDKGPVNVADATLTSAFNFDITGWEDEKDGSEFGHRWPRIWYTRSVTSPKRTGVVGFKLSLEGGTKEYNKLRERFPGKECEITKPLETAICGLSINNPLIMQ